VTLFLAGVALGSLLTSCVLALCILAGRDAPHPDPGSPADIDDVAPLPYTDMRSN
jgi:hypothetical protein